MVERPRLLEVVALRHTLRVVSIVAGAGCGKTTLLAQAMTAAAGDPAVLDVWLTCRSEHSTAGLGPALLGAAPGPTDDPIAGVVDAVWRRAPVEVALVLDDVHVLEPGSPGARDLTRLVDLLPANGHLTLAGRTEPPVPLARRTACGEVAHLDEADLLFRDDELGALASLRGVDVEVLSRWGGWAALAELAAGRPALVDRFLWEEVLDQLPASLRTALAIAAELGGADPPLLDAAVGEPVDVEALLSVPLVSWSAAGEITPHALWLDQPEVADAALLAEVRTRAAHRLAERGQVDRAVRLAGAAGGHELVLQLIGGACGFGPGAGITPDLAESWLTLLPSSARDHPAALLICAVAALGRDQGDATVLGLLWRAADDYHLVGDAEGETAALAQLGYVARIRADRDLRETVVRRVEDVAATGCRPAVALAAVGRADLATIDGDFATALTAVRAVPSGSLPNQWQVASDWLEANALIQLGRPEEAIPIAGRAAEHPTPMLPGARAAVLMARWYAGDGDRILAGDDDVLDASAAARDRFVAGVFRAMTGALAGHRERASDAIDEMTRSLGGLDEPESRAFVRLVDALLAVDRGDEDEAVTALRSLLAALPVDHPLVERTLRLVTGTVYVLLPELRPRFDEVDAGPAWRQGRNLAAAVVAARGGDLDPVGRLRMPRPGVVLAHLPARVGAELAAALVAAGREEDGVATAQWLAATCGATIQEGLALLADRGGPVGRGATSLRSRLPRPPAAPVRVRLLGVASLASDQAEAIAAWRRGPVRSLCGYLAVHRRAAADTVAGALWADRPADRASHNLRVTLNHLRRVLEPDRAPGEPSYLVARDGPWLSLVDDGHLGIDVWDVERHLASAATAPDAAEELSALEAAVEAYGGQFLADVRVTAEWAAAEQRRLEDAVTRAATRASQLALAGGDASRAGRLAARALDIDPWHDAAHRAAIAACRAQGDEAAIRRATARAAEAAADLGVSPRSPGNPT